MPAPITNTVASRTKTALRTDASISRAITWHPLARRATGRETFERGLQVAFRIDQEIGSDDDPLALRETVEDLGEAAAAGPHFDDARGKTPLALLDQHHLPGAAVDHGRVRHRQHRRAATRGGDLDARIHRRPQGQLR